MTPMLDHPRLLLTLDPDQAQAAAMVDRHLLVVAGPGAGKTRVVIGRIQHLLTHGDAAGQPVAPSEICCITFTNKACSEIVARIRDHFPAEAEEITVRTFHGLAREIVQRFHEVADLPRHFHIIDEATQDDILQFACRKHQLRRDPLVLRRLKSHLDLEKSAMRYPLTHPQAKGAALEELPRLYTYYQSFLRDHGILDFNDLLLAAIQILMGSREAVRWVQGRCRFLLLDEFQDVNQAQYELIRLLAGPSMTVLAVADGNQMIYGWRGSNSAYLHLFRREFEAEVIELTRNYRAAEDLQVLARQLIHHNTPDRPVPPLAPTLTDKHATHFQLLDEDEEVLAIRKVIQAALKSDPTLQYRDIAILYRTHDIADRLERDLALADIPVQRVRKQTEELAGGIEHLVAYLRLSQHLFDWDLYRAMEYPRRLLSPWENLWVNQAHQAAELPLLDLLSGELPSTISPLSQGKLRRFATLVRELHAHEATQAPSAFFKQLVASLGEFRSPFTEDEENALLERLQQGDGQEQETIAGMHQFLRESPTGRFLVVHNGTVTGLLAALISREAIREYLHRQMAVGTCELMHQSQWEKLAADARGAEVCVLTLGLSAEQDTLMRQRAGEASLSGPWLTLAPQPPFPGESFEVALDVWGWWAWCLAQPLTPLTGDGVYIDLETTGKEPYRCHLLEVAALRVDLATGAVRDRYQTFVQPPGTIPSKVQEITGITEAMVAEAPQAGRVLPQVLEFIGTLPLIGHNLEGFDLPILRRYAQHLAQVELTNLPVDTLRWARELLPRQSHSQEALCQRFGLAPPEGGQHHRAMVDVELLHQLVPHLTRLDAIKRGLLFSQTALVLLALASYQDETAPDALRIAIREAGKRILQRHEEDDRDLAMLIGRHFTEFQAARLVALLKLLQEEPLGDDAAYDRFARHVAALREQMLRFEEAHPTEGVREFLQFHYLLSDQDFLSSENTVKLLTVHAAKGLEFEVVIIVGLEQGSFPHHLAIRHLSRIEEERRLLYVALTRARRKVYLTSVETRHGRYRPPSMFLRELPRQVLRRFRSDKLNRRRGRAA
ncbi:MAG: ATP-dependent DNA helicase Rep [bacterium]|nr:ATP-dependent DNA helicase Rep [bacterium]